MKKEIRIVVVDKDDNIISSKSRSEMDYTVDIYRCSCLWVTNSKGEILLARRHHTKSHDPNKWSGAVAGTVEEGETYESNMYKEAEEEIGLKGIAFTLGPKQFFTGSKKFFVQWYFAVVDKTISEFKIQEDEIEEIAWINKENLLQDVSQNPSDYIESMPSILELLVK